MDSDSDSVIDVNAVCGVPKAFLTCRQNSHPFQERVLNLDQPVKIGRSVARTRASVSNGIFDCKVLSRNHAIMWYENERFYIQDTKSSNGTFVNSQRLSRGAEDSPPRELWSGDILQFGVDVLENQRKGNEESDSCDDSIHIVTHGCIVATVKLLYPNGKEAKPSSNSNVYPQEDLCALQLILYEAQQREERLRGKLDNIEGLVTMIQDTSRDALNQRFEESRLLSKIETLEKRIKVLNKMKTGETAESDMISQLLSEVEKVQSVSRVIQERLHRELIASGDSLTITKLDASNLQSEIQALSDVSQLNEGKLQELATKCNGYMTTIENLESVLKAHKKDNMDLEERVEGLQVREEMFQKLLTHPLGKVIYEQLLLDDGYESLREAGANVDKVVSEWYDKFFPILKDHVNEEEAWKLIKRLLETIFAEMDQSRKNFETLTVKKQALIMKLEDARLPHQTKIKTENYPDENDDLEKVINSDAINNESIAELEKELKEVEDHLWEASKKRKTFETRCKSMKVELDSGMNSQAVDKGDLNEEKTDGDHSDTLTVHHLRHLVETLSTETEKGDNDFEKFILRRRQDGSTQTLKVTLATKETMTSEITNIVIDEVPSITSNASEGIVETVVDEVVQSGQDCEPLTLHQRTLIRPLETDRVQHRKILKTEQFTDENGGMGSVTMADKSEIKYVKVIESTESVSEGSEEDMTAETLPSFDCPSDYERLGSSEENTAFKTDEVSSSPKRSDSADSTNEPYQFLDEAGSRLKNLATTGTENDIETLSMWDKMRQIYEFCDETMAGVPAAEERLASIRQMINMVSEDLVTLLVHDKKREEERKQLHERLSQSLTQADVAALSFADRFLALVVGLVICYVGSRILSSLGL